MLPPFPGGAYNSLQMPPDPIVTITDGNFESEVTDSGTPFLLDFSAEWCGPCRQMAPLVKEIALAWEGRLGVGLVDIEQSPGTAARFGVMSVPTFVFLGRDGVEAARFVGSVPRDRLAEAAGKVVD